MSQAGLMRDLQASFANWISLAHNEAFNKALDYMYKIVDNQFITMPKEGGVLHRFLQNGEQVYPGYSEL